MTIDRHSKIDVNGIFINIGFYIRLLVMFMQGVML